jgi:hypothetical protein
MNLLVNEKRSFQLGVSYFLRNAKSKPDNYTSGAFPALFTLGLSEIVLDQIVSYQFLYGKMINLTESGHVRLNFSGGIGYAVLTEPSNWKPIHNSGGWASNYSYDIQKHKKLCLLVNPKFEFPLSRVVGLSLSPMLAINSERTFVGVGFGTIIGRLRTSQLSW